jgi:hypothetical protein
MKMFETTNQLVSLGNEATRTYSKHEENMRKTLLLAS